MTDMIQVCICFRRARVFTTDLRPAEIAGAQAGGGRRQEEVEMVHLFHLFVPGGALQRLI
jgi:hypothetical protein